MKEVIGTFIRECPQQSRKAADMLGAIDELLDDSVESLKASISEAIDRRHLERLEELHALVKSIDRFQQKLRYYIKLLDAGVKAEPATYELSTPEEELATALSGSRIVVRVCGELIKAATIKELLQGVLEVLDSKRKLDQLLPSLPIATSSKRYLFAWEPIHPSGKPFFAPMEYGGILL